jgi:hypothetical protein
MSDPEQFFDEDEPFDLERAPLDPPEGPVDRDWGGDGSDPGRPRRAHVLAALQPPTDPYPPPLDALLTLGEQEDEEVQAQLVALGIGQEHVPDLARMARDRALFTADSDRPEVWAQNHALVALAELDPAPVIGSLVPLLDVQDDWLPTLLEPVFVRAGAAAIAPLQSYLADPSRWAWGHSFACDLVAEVVEARPELRGEALEILAGVLREAETRHELAVSGAVSALVELRALDMLPLIRHAFEVDKVDPMLRGSWGDIQQELGVTPSATDPLVERSRRQHESALAQLRSSMKMANARPPVDARAANEKRKQSKVHTEKNKRKAAKASRKANRKKRK